MMKNSLKRGFTLIELLVVIAIIGILASVVLASLNSARDKGHDASAKASVNNIRAAAEVIYDDADGSYVNVCNDGDAGDAANDVTALGAAAASETNGTFTCIDDANGYSASIQLRTDSTEYFCVDSTGSAGIGAVNTTTACP